MTKEEAIAAMRQGKRVTHHWFTSDEWMTIDRGEILLEDGVRCDYYEFWNSRFQEGWKDGYSLFE
jgi:hypothetical protein